MASGERTPQSVDSSHKDPAWFHFTKIDPNNRNDLRCNYCGKITKGGAYRAKQHLVGGFRNTRACPKVPSHIREEIKEYMSKKQADKESIFQTPTFPVDDFDDEDPDLGIEVNSRGKRISSGQSSSRGSTLKTAKTKGPMDLFCRPSVEQFVKDRKEGKERQQTINEVVKKKERDWCARDIARFFFMMRQFRLMLLIMKVLK